MVDLPVPVVLASSSPTRRELLAQVLSDFDVVVPRVDEDAFPPGDPQELTMALARAKAMDVAGRRPDALVIAADTVVVCNGLIMGKPADIEDAVRMLQTLTRNPHSVVTGLAAAAPDGRVRCGCVSAGVHMRPMSREAILDYISRHNALERAGGYALERDDPHLERIDGSLSAVMGLPMEELERMLADLYPQGHAPA